MQARLALDESRFVDAAQWAHQAHAAALVEEDDSALANALEVEGFAAHHDSRYVEARALGEATLDAYQRLNDLAGQGRALYLLGILHRELNDIALALDYHQRQIEMCTRAGDSEGLTKAYNGLAGAYLFNGDLAHALTFTEKVLALTETTGDLARRAISYANLVQILIRMGDVDRGVVLIPSIVALHDRLGDQISPSNRSHFYSRASRIYLDKGDYARALAFTERGLALTQQVALPRRRAILLGDRADIYIAQGLFGQALAPLHEAYALAEAHGFLLWIDGVLESLTTVCERMGDFQAAFLWQRRRYTQREHLLDTERQRTIRQTEARYQVEAARKETEDYRQEAAQSETKRQTLERLNRLKDELLTTASHDIKNPLASIRLTLDLLRRSESDNPLMRLRHIARIDDQVERISRLIGDLLDLAKLEAGSTLEIAPIRVVDLLAWAAREYMLRAADREIRLVVIPTEPRVMMMGDRDRLEQVMDNLVSNAIKYTLPGGMVTIEAVHNDQGITLMVHDTGMGIPDEALAHIFDPFYRVQRPDHLIIEGTGLGLAIAQTVVQQHGSVLHVESAVGEGSTFRFVLPSQ
ncbi:MAG: tetratricopeptide repeat-containing sensor histidine kinase [Chloroflexota bacterium]|nr:tetratricopeptide repeat-containing sensor histidine kinase [Chloroflexota bacterium]